jgi:hypothetical protein
VWVNQITINVALALFDPSGRQIYDGDINRIAGAEIAMLISDTPGEYKLRIAAPAGNDPVGQYDVSLMDIAPATEALRHRSTANAILARALGTFKRGEDESIRRAINILEAGLAEIRASLDLAGESAFGENIRWNVRTRNDENRCQ